ncbi:MAG: hypothetical protein U0354_05910 [Candidatus Sericytochromatia bacterium]
MCNTIQTKSIKSNQYTSSNTSMQTPISDVNQTKFENKVETKNTIIQTSNKVDLKDIKETPIDPNSSFKFYKKPSTDLIVKTDNSIYYDTNLDNKSSKPSLKATNMPNLSNSSNNINIDISNNEDRKQVLMSQIKKLYENYKGLFGRVINEDKEIRELFDMLNKSINTNTLPQDQDLENLKNAIQKFTSSDKFITSDFRNKEDRKAFISSFNSMINNIDNLNKGQQLEQQFVDTSNKVSNKLINLIDAINKSPNKSPLTESLKKIMSKYNEALASGDKKLIALYSALIDKLTTAINNGASGEDIAKILTDYNNLVTRMYDPSISSEQVNKELKEFLGDDLYKVFVSDVRGVAAKGENKKPQGGTTGKTGSQGGNSSGGISINSNTNPNQTQTETNNEEQGEDNAEENPIDIMRAEAARDPQKPRPTVIPTEYVDQIRVMTSEDVKNVIESVADLSEGLKELQGINRELIQSQIELYNFNQSVVISVKVDEKDPVRDNIKENVRKIIENVEKMESELDLEVRQGETTIVTLLQKFREIINQLDLDSRNNIKKMIDSYLIDQKNQNYIRDMELRWKSLDKAREMVNKVFDEIKEKNIA